MKKRRIELRNNKIFRSHSYQFCDKESNEGLNIVFLCGSLEPGCDGVGDYTRRLAAAVQRWGHQVFLIASHDRFLKTSTMELQQCEGIKVQALRISSDLPNKDRLQMIKKEIAIKQPNWLSLQYVPFAFHRKGLPFFLSRFAASIGEGRRWHIMFHELWVGMEKNAGVKHNLWGLLQHKIVKRLITKLHPQVVHTQCSLYKEHLRETYRKTAILPLFSNINLYGHKVSASISNSGEEKNKFVVVVFGSIHHGAPIQAFASELRCWSKKKNTNVLVRFVGRNGNELSSWTTAFDNNNIAVEVLGEKPSPEIASILSEASMGLISTPYALVEKSGTCAAMLESDLPVICVARPWIPKRNSILQHGRVVIEYKEGELENCFDAEKNNQYSYTLEIVARQFVSSLKKVYNG